MEESRSISMGEIHRWNFISVIGSLNEIQGQTYGTTGRDGESNEKSGDNGQLCLSFSVFSLPSYRNTQQLSLILITRAVSAWAGSDTAGYCCLNC